MFFSDSLMGWAVLLLVLVKDRLLGLGDRAVRLLDLEHAVVFDGLAYGLGILGCRQPASHRPPRHLLIVLIVVVIVAVVVVIDRLAVGRGAHLHVRRLLLILEDGGLLLLLGND